MLMILMNQKIANLDLILIQIMKGCHIDQIPKIIFINLNNQHNQEKMFYLILKAHYKVI